MRCFLNNRKFLPYQDNEQFSYNSSHVTLNPHELSLQKKSQLSKTIFPSFSQNCLFTYNIISFTESNAEVLKKK